MKDELWLKLVRGAKGIFGLRIAYLVLGFFLNIVVARALGVKEFGIYTYVLSWVWLISLFTKMGFAELLVREVAVFENSNNWGLLRGILKFSNLMVLFLSVVIILFHFLVSYFFLPNTINPPLQSAFAIGLIVIPIISLTALRQGVLTALHKVVQGQIPELLFKPTGLLFCFVFVSSFWPRELNANSALLINLLVSIMAFFLGYILLRKALPKVVYAVEAKYSRVEWSVSALRFLMIGGMLVINSQADKIMLGMMSEISNVGIYSVVTFMASLSGYSMVALSSAISPVLVKLLKGKEHSRLQEVIIKSTKIAIGVSLLSAIFLFVLSEVILSQFGSEFIIGRTSLAILLLGQVVFVSAGSAGLIMNMMGHERVVAYVVTISAMVNIILNFILIPRYGMAGAAIATTVSLSMWSLTLMMILYRKDHIASSPLLVPSSIIK